SASAPVTSTRWSLTASCRRLAVKVLAWCGCAMSSRQPCERSPAKVTMTTARTSGILRHEQAVAALHPHLSRPARPDALLRPAPRIQTGAVAWTAGLGRVYGCLQQGDRSEDGVASRDRR